MKKISLFFLILFIAATFVLVSAKPSAPICPIKPETNVVFYGETGWGGVGTLSKSWITKFFDWWKSQDPSINYAILDSSDVKTDCNLANYPNVKVYVQPGGDGYKQQNKLGSLGKNNINSYIDSGRGYVGICAGFYYTASDYYWQSEYYSWPDLLGKYPTVEGSIIDLADYEASPGYVLTNVGNFNMIYYGGPTVGWKNTPQLTQGQALLSYNSIPGNLPAAIKDKNMLLMSVHAEAFENDGISGLSTEQRIENYKWLANAINSVSGTTFYVPAYTNLPVCGNAVCEYSEDWHSCLQDCPAPECSDSIDNDADSLIDFPADTGCSSAEDNDETDLMSGLVLYEGFENGMTGWTTEAVTGANPWLASVLNPYSGSYSAQSKPMSTTQPASILERTISTSGYGPLKLSYYRKLVGLDTADEFQAEWFDGTTWTILEQTGSSSANDAGYVYKEFSLPGSASNNPNFRLRFECTAGATTEMCRVDEIRLISV